MCGLMGEIVLTVLGCIHLFARVPPQDDQLRAAVEEFQEKNWKKIAARLPGRTDVQCLHRWQKVTHTHANTARRFGWLRTRVWCRQVLRPGLVKGPWTEEVRASHTLPPCL